MKFRLLLEVFVVCLYSGVVLALTPPTHPSPWGHAVWNDFKSRAVAFIEPSVAE